MTTAISTTTQVHRVFIKAPADRIWEAITDPAFNSRYGYGTPNHFELRPGGAFHVEASQAMIDHGASNPIIDGEVLEVDPPRRLVQTWRALFDPATAAEPANRLTWEIDEDPRLPGTCRLTITHELEDAPVTAIQVAGDNPDAGGGWPFILSDLKSYLETGSSLAQ
ncbi:MAG: hypothetical protein QOI80_3391 [Solirubrobacteraceae bacterium]|jgi:uncharacterized protein YndB with AHSA1/START domain|nr:hypothetical protein [Solirubrobacteraceae bacterium]